MPLGEMVMSKYYHVTNVKSANDIIKNGFGGPASKKRFKNEDAWWDFYHYVLPLFSEQEQEKLLETLYNDKLSESDRGSFMQDAVAEKFGNNWTIMWVSKDKVFPGFLSVPFQKPEGAGKGVLLEYFPDDKDIIFRDTGHSAVYYIVLRAEERFPANNFRKIGFLESEDDSDEDFYSIQELVDKGTLTLDKDQAAASFLVRASRKPKKMSMRKTVDVISCQS